MVVAPVPWFPFKHEAFGRYASSPGCRGRNEARPHRAASALSADSQGRHVERALSHVCCAEEPVHREIEARFRFDLIDTHYFYPDGVAAVLLGRSLGKPVVITARGTDVNLLPEYRVPRRLVRWAAAQAAGVVAVSEALRERLIELGVPGSRVRGSPQRRGSGAVRATGPSGGARGNWAWTPRARSCFRSDR